MDVGSLVAIAFEATRWSIGFLLLWRLPALPASGQRPLAREDVAVIIPARNEENNLPELLASLRSQRPLPAEVVVVDDASTDETAALARAGGARVLKSGDFARGWIGKTHACANGAAATTAGALVFLDADTRLTEHDVLGRLAAQVDAAPGGLVTVQPSHRTERAYESFNGFFVLASLMGTGAFTIAGRRASAVGAFGPCLAMTRASYDAVGGHSHPEVRGSIVDDVALAARYRADDRPVVAFGGAGSVAYRLYPNGPRELIDGWTKNIAAGAGVSPPALLALVVVWLSGCITAAWRLVFGVSAATGLTYAAYALAIAMLLRRTGRFPFATALVFPVPLAVFLLTFLRASTLRALGRPVRWKARKVETRTRSKS